MSPVFERPSLLQRIKPIFTGYDLPLLIAMVLLAVAGMVTMYSAGFDSGTRFGDHGRNMLLALGVIFIVAQVPPQTLMRFAVPLYLAGVALLIAVAVAGVTKKGATRWLNVGVVIQPSEILKIAMPLMLAWWFQRCEGREQRADFIVALLILAVPVALIVKQPDLGTAILVLSAGLYVIFFAGLSWRLILPVFLVGALAISAVVLSEDRICQPDLKWPLLRDYQKNRVCTLLDPTTDPLGKGFHIIQGMIAIGSGGIEGKGFMKGTQTHLEFIPERTTDFIFAAFSEEFGLIGCGSLVLGFTFLIFRGLMIAAEAPTVFTRLLAGSISLSWFTYAFVNMGMVSGILPVVGVPLPFISYGGTAMVHARPGLGHADVDRQKQALDPKLIVGERSNRTPKLRTSKTTVQTSSFGDNWKSIQEDNSLDTAIKAAPSSSASANVNSEKSKALQAALQQIDKQFGKGTIMRLGVGEVIEDIEVVSTGSLGLDMALGVGGLPRGRVVEIYGPESSGKTTLTLQVIAQMQRVGGTCAFIDAEHALDINYAQKLGVNLQELLISQPDTGEQALEIVDALVRSGSVDLVVVDSVAALTPKAEIEGEMGDSLPGLQARLMSQALRKLTGSIKRTNTMVIFINQIRMKIGVMFGSPETTTGGNALKFYASVRLDIRRIGSIKKGEEVIGNETKVKVVKNKVSPPFKNR